MYATVAKAGTADWDRLMAVAGGMEPALRRAFLESIRDLLKKISLAEVIRRVDSGTWETLLDDTVVAQAQFAPMREAIRVSVIGSAQRTASQIKGFSGAFDLYNPSAVDFLQRYTFDRIREMTAQIKTNIRDQVIDGIKEGVNPRVVARRIRSINTFGLTTSQRQAVANFRRLITSGDREALTRVLRDKRFDASLRAAILGEKTLDAEHVDRMVNAYERRYLKYRSEAIARSEAMRALNEGQRLAWKQYAEQKKVPESSIRRRWFVARDERTCDICRPIPRLNPDGRGLDEPFVTPEGPFLLPPIHPHCRCVVFTRPD